MSYNLKDVVYEAPNGNWVLKKEIGHYEMYKTGCTHSIRKATIHFSNDDSKALARAIKTAEGYL